MPGPVSMLRVFAKSVGRKFIKGHAFGEYRATSSIRLSRLVPMKAPDVTAIIVKASSMSTPPQCYDTGLIQTRGEQ